VCAHACNDFEPVVTALEPRVDADLRALRDAGAPLAMLSGSGACSFALCATEADARELMRAVRVPSDTKLVVAPFANAVAWR